MSAKMTTFEVSLDVIAEKTSNRGNENLATAYLPAAERAMVIQHG